MSDQNTIQERIEEIKGLVAQGQERFETLEERGQKTEEGFEELKADFGKLCEELQTLTDQAATEVKAREELEAALARIPEKNADGETLLGDAEYRRSFKSYARRGNVGIMEALEAEGDALIKMYDIEGEQSNEVKALAVGSNPDGGFLAPIDMARQIMTRIFETSPVRQVANVITTSREAVEVIIDDQEAESVWAGEVDTVAETDTPQIGTLEIPTHEQRAEPKATQKILDDASINIESWLQNKVADKFRRAENTAFVNGTGVKQPTGMLTLGEWADEEEYERGKLATIETSTSGDLDEADDLIALQTLLLEEYQSSAQWMMNRQTWGGKILTLKDNDGAYLINPQLIYQGVNFQLLGRPVRLAGDFPVTAAGAKIIAYGDFMEGYTIVDRIGIRVLRDPYTSKPYVKFYTTKRVGGNVTNYQALKILKVQS